MRSCRRTAISGPTAGEHSKLCVQSGPCFSSLTCRRNMSPSPSLKLSLQKWALMEQKRSWVSRVLLPQAWAAWAGSCWPRTWPKAGQESLAGSRKGGRKTRKSASQCTKLSTNQGAPRFSRMVSGQTARKLWRPFLVSQTRVTKVHENKEHRLWKCADNHRFLPTLVVFWESEAWLCLEGQGLTAAGAIRDRIKTMVLHQYIIELQRESQRSNQIMARGAADPTWSFQSYSSQTSGLSRCRSFKEKRGQVSVTTVAAALAVQLKYCRATYGGHER